MEISGLSAKGIKAEMKYMVFASRRGFGENINQVRESRGAQIIG